MEVKVKVSKYKIICSFRRQHFFWLNYMFFAKSIITLKKLLMVALFNIFEIKIGNNIKHVGKIWPLKV